MGPAVVKCVDRFQLQPNPASTWVTFTYDLPQLPMAAVLTLTDLTGRVIYSERTAQASG